MSQESISLRPLIKLTIMKSLREVDSPRSTNSEEGEAPPEPPFTRKLTAPASDHQSDLYMEDRELQSALEFSIDDLFSKIEKITSEFTVSSNSEPSSLQRLPSQP